MDKIDPGKFIADVHLGKLARYLCLPGFDTVYRNDYTFREICTKAAEEIRIVLSKNPELSLLPSGSGFLITGERTKDQLNQVVPGLDLHGKIQPFTRCLVCNGILKKVGKTLIRDQLKEKIALYYEVFRTCSGCGKLY